MESQISEKGVSLSYASYRSALGDIFVLDSGEGLLATGIGGSEEAFVERALKGTRLLPKERPYRFVELFKLLDDYFAGKKVDFVVDFKLSGTPFELSVWRVLRGIPYGECRSYSWVAAEAARKEGGGSPKAYRAVGRACGANPMPIIIPCHRVVSASGRIGGFAESAGGLDMKRRLLQLEGVTLI